MSVAKISPLPRTEMDALLLGRLDELTVSTDSASKSRSFFGILISILVLMLISSMIVAAIVIMNPDITNLSARYATPREPITLEEVMLGELNPSPVSLQWLQPTANKSSLDSSNGYKGTASPEPESESDILLFEDSRNLNTLVLTTRMRQSLVASTNLAYLSQPPINFTTLVPSTSLLSSIDYQGFKVSPNKRYLLIWTSRRKVFRHSFTAKYFLYDIKLDLISMLSTRRTIGSSQFVHNSYENLDSASQYLNDQDEGNEYTRFQYVDWFSSQPSQSPSDNQQTDSLILIQNNDIFMLKDVASDPNSINKNQQSMPIRLTFTGKSNTIFNGVADWLYEEEILSDSAAFQVSPRGDTLAYMSFNDSLVDLMPFSYYGPTDQLFPETRRVRYPKAGRVNPYVTVHIIDNLSSASQYSSNRDIHMSLPYNLAERQHYINRIKWLDNNRLAIVWTSRRQNESYVIVCSRNSTSNNWDCLENLHLVARGGWLDMTDDLHFLDEDHYLTLLLKDEGPAVGSFKHVAKVSLSKPNTYDFLTNGKKEVQSISGIDRSRSLVFYISTGVNEPGERHLFSASTNGAFSSACLTCDLYPNDCRYNDVKMSPSTRHYIFECFGPGIPRTELRSTQVALPEFSTFQQANQSDIRSLSYPIDSETIPNLQAAGLSVSSSNENVAVTKSVLPTTQKSVPELRQASSYQADVHTGASISNNTNNIPIVLKSNVGRRKRSSAGLVEDPTAVLGDDRKAQGISNDSGSEGGSSGLDYRGSNNDVSPSTTSSLLWVIEDNRVLKDKLLRTKAMPLMMRLKVPIPGTDYLANVIMFLPPQLGYGSPTSPGTENSFTSTAFNRNRRSPLLNLFQSTMVRQQQPQSLGLYYTPETIREYSKQIYPGVQFPMVVDVYGGPNSQKVDFRYHANFGYYMASSRRTIYVMIDGRGSGNQGTKRLYELYQKFGTVEIQDQIDVTAYLTRNFSFIDPSKVAIWGWSYGGYAAAMALAHSNAKSLNDYKNQIRASQTQNSTLPAKDKASLTFNQNSPGNPATSQLSQFRGVFECAASVAPVTNWIYYDTAYTERYMSSPYKNERFDRMRGGDHLPEDDRSAMASSHVFLAGQEQELANKSQSWLPLNQTLGTSLGKNLIDLARETQQSKIKRIAHIDLNERYTVASLIENIAQIDRKRFLLIHGTADDNVHFQQSMMLMKQLIRKNILFETRLYPDQDHSISNKADAIHLGSTLSNFFAECFEMA